MHDHDPKLSTEAVITLLTLAGMLLAFCILVGAAWAQPAIVIESPIQVKISRTRTDSAAYTIQVPLSGTVMVRGNEVKVAPGDSMTVAVPGATRPEPPLGVTWDQIDAMMARLGRMTDVTRDTVLCPERVPVLVGPQP